MHNTTRALPALANRSSAGRRASPEGLARARELRVAAQDSAPLGPDGATGDSGFSTAELLGNAALGIAALIAIWAVLQTLGINVVQWIGQQLGVPAG